MLIDIYVLAPERTKTAVQRFLAKFLPYRKQTATEFEVPEFSNSPAIVFMTTEEVIDYCCVHPNASQRIYWLNSGKLDPQSAHLYFLLDGGMVFGLSVAEGNEYVWNQWLIELRSFTGAAYGYWTGECPPEDTLDEFIALARKCSASQQLNYLDQRAALGNRVSFEEALDKVADVEPEEQDRL
jgi:hypothetical protein